MNRTVLHILIASPSDTASERRVISEVIRDWNSAHASTSPFILQDRLWELDCVPEMGASPQEIVNRQIVDSADILIAVFSGRLGSPTSVASSGTVEEIERARSAQKPVLIYFSNAPLPRNHDPQQWHSLKAYKDELGTKSLYREFTTVDDLRRAVTHNLAATLAKQETLVNSLWDHYNGQRTFSHNGQQLYEQTIPGNHISHSLPAPYTARSLVEAVAQHSQTPIPVDSLTALPDQRISSRGEVFFGNPGKYIDGELDKYLELEWWFSDKGLNITKVSSS